MNFLVKSGALLAVAAAGAAVVMRLAVPSAPDPAPPAPPVPVVSAAVQQHDEPIVLAGLGTVQALNTATIRSQITGLLQTVTFVEGQQVHRGDTLAQIDPRPYQARLAQTQAQLGHDQAQLANLQVNLNRNLPLLSRGFATDQQVTDQRSQVTQLQNTLKSDQAAIDDAQTQLDYTTLVAPFDGVTGVRKIDVGNVIHPTDADGLVTVTQVQPISVLFTLPAADIAQVQDALSKGAVTAVAYDQAGTRVLDTGKLLLVNNQADPQSGTVQLKALFPNAARRLWPGTFVNVELTTAVVAAALTVPTDAVQQGPQGMFVYLIGADQKVAVRPVQVAQQLRGVALVSNGLNPGETVVVQGQYRLTEGATVVPSQPAQVASSSTATAGMLP
jgi:multidrug efflux system membrane fusion protein